MQVVQLMHKIFGGIPNLYIINGLKLAHIGSAPAPGIIHKVPSHAQTIPLRA